MKSFFALQKSSKRKDDDLEGQKKGKVIKFGWIEGVYVSNQYLFSAKVVICFNYLDAVSP